MKNNYIYGWHAIASLLVQQPERIQKLWVLKGNFPRRPATGPQDSTHGQRHQQLLAKVLTLGITIEEASRHELDRLTHAATHQGIVALCLPAPIYQHKDLATLLQPLTNPPVVLVLDGIQDPHNLGACFRSADAAGVHAIVAPKDNAVSITPVVSKVASGAVETIPFVQVTNLVRAIEELKQLGLWIYGAAAEAEQTLYQTDFKVATALVLGAEGSGLRRLTKAHCDGLIKIPMQGSVSSLNVSVAAGICLFEVVRQRL